MLKQDSLRRKKLKNLSEQRSAADSGVFQKLVARPKLSVNNYSTTTRKRKIHLANTSSFPVTSVTSSASNTTMVAAMKHTMRKGTTKATNYTNAATVSSTVTNRDKDGVAYNASYDSLNDVQIAADVDENVATVVATSATLTTTINTPTTTTMTATVAEMETAASSSALVTAKSRSRSSHVQPEQRQAAVKSKVKVSSRNTKMCKRFKFISSSILAAHGQPK